MRGLLVLAGVGALVGVGALAYAKSREDSAANDPNLIPVWDPAQGRWVYARVTPNGLEPTNIPAPPIGRPINRTVV